jgi:hypothetical protein
MWCCSKMAIGNRESGTGKAADADLLRTYWHRAPLRSFHAEREQGQAFAFPIPDSRFPIPGCS